MEVVLKSDLIINVALIIYTQNIIMAALIFPMVLLGLLVLQRDFTLLRDFGDSMWLTNFGNTPTIRGAK